MLTELANLGITHTINIIDPSKDGRGMVHKILFRFLDTTNMDF